ncbi:hypothetical protein MCC01967_00140 [Bifidobacteriaceae bacterium MCC01967]|nr:hypothetical protein MCC01967_00140 [Bifidobacteriaceae bacterium MCC01967]
MIFPLSISCGRIQYSIYCCSQHTKHKKHTDKKLPYFTNCFLDDFRFFRFFRFCVMVLKETQTESQGYAQSI